MANIEKNIAMFNNVGCRVVVVSFGTAKVSTEQEELFIFSAVIRYGWLQSHVFREARDG